MVCGRLVQPKSAKPDVFCVAGTKSRLERKRVFWVEQTVLRYVVAPYHPGGEPEIVLCKTPYYDGLSGQTVV